MNKLITFRNSVLAGMLCLVAASCSDDGDTDNRLPDGKYPMTFTASVDGLAVTRTTTENDWTGGEEVAIQIGNETKKYTTAAGGSLTFADDGNPFYWTHKVMNVSAWYSSAYSDTRPTTFSVKEEQSSDGYQESDFLYVSQSISFLNAESTTELTFKHLPAKVMVNLKYGDGVTADEVSTATVGIVNQATASGEIAEDGTVAQATSGSVTITPHTLTSAASGYQKSVQALLVPQQMKDKSFIQVTIGTGAAARYYFYTPARDNDADLTAGKQYTYNITVKKEGLQVESVSASWDGETSEDEAEGAVFKVYLADFTAPANTSDYKVTNAGDEELTAEKGTYSVSDEIKISLSANENYRLKTFLTSVDAGICKQKVDYTAATRTYTYTFYDIRSDLWLDGVQAEAEAATTSLSDPQVGDYYYVDGTWSSTLEKPCIGIVFKVGTGTDDAASNYTGLKDNTIHGYVVAVNDAHTDVGAWGIRETDVDGLDNNSSASNKYDGYINTAVIRQLDAYGTTDVSQPMKNGQYWAFKVASLYAVTAPGNTSGWYLPSIQQLADIYALSDLATRLATAGGTDFERTENNGRYWSATEKNGYDAWYYQFSKGSSSSYAKSNDGGNYLSSSKSYVRAILTF